MPDIFNSWPDGRTAVRLPPGVPDSHLFDPRLSLHPQYVLENGVDFAHFKYVHKVPLIPQFTRQEFDAPISYVDFTVAFEA